MGSTQQMQGHKMCLHCHQHHPSVHRFGTELSWNSLEPKENLLSQKHRVKMRLHYKIQIHRFGTGFFGSSGWNSTTITYGHRGLPRQTIHHLLRPVTPPPSNNPSLAGLTPVSGK